MAGHDSKLDEKNSKSGYSDNPSSILPTGSNSTGLGPSTDYESRKVILRAERQDTVEITNVKQQYSEIEIPGFFIVVERTDTYYGPELLLAANGQNFLLTAPGPDTQLLLWIEKVNEELYREKWAQLAEVQVQISETPQYELCDQCGSPIRSREHARLSAIGRCPKTCKT